MFFKNIKTAFKNEKSRFRTVKLEVTDGVLLLACYAFQWKTPSTKKVKKQKKFANANF